MQTKYMPGPVSEIYTFFLLAYILNKKKILVHIRDSKRASSVRQPFVTFFGAT